jgi:hypothetical protein
MRTRPWVVAVAGVALALGGPGLASAIDWDYGTPTDQGVVIAVEGAPFSGSVWRGFRCAGSEGASATVDWGDGTGVDSATATVSYDPSNRTCGITASHRYAEEGSYPVTLVYTDSTGATQSLTRSGTVFDAPLPAPAVLPLHTTAGQPVTGTIATFSDPGGDPADYAMTIDWGDRQNTSGGLAGRAITGAHTYAGVGSYQVTVTVVDDGGTAATGYGTVTVRAAAASRSDARNAVISDASIDSKGVITLVLSRPATLYGEVSSLPGSHRVGTVNFGRRSAGHATLRWHVGTLHGRRLHPGRYAIQVRTGRGPTALSGPSLHFVVR